MDYRIEELLPLVTWLTDKYTSKESSSVPYETAQMLMEAIIYCMDENRGQYPMAEAGKLPAARIMYERGYEIVLEKVYASKELFEQIMKSFEDYGCMNYRDTVLYGMPAFFTNYDPRFQPQNHLLTMDYPLLGGYPDLCGADLILEYLKGIQEEQMFLNCFERRAVINLLESILPEYQELYLDNICQVVLLRAIECFIAECPVRDLVLSEGADEENRIFWAEDNKQLIDNKTIQLIRIIMKQFEINSDYFEKAAPGLGSRIWQKYLVKYE